MQVWGKEILLKYSIILYSLKCFLFCVNEYYVYIYVYASYVCLVPTEDGWECEIPWNWHYRWLQTTMWALGTKFKSSKSIPYHLTLSYCSSPNDLFKNYILLLWMETHATVNVWRLEDSNVELVLYFPINPKIKLRLSSLLSKCLASP